MNASGPLRDAQCRFIPTNRRYRRRTPSPRCTAEERCPRVALRYRMSCAHGSSPLWCYGVAGSWVRHNAVKSPLTCDGGCGPGKLGDAQFPCDASDLAGGDLIHRHVAVMRVDDSQVGPSAVDRSERHCRIVCVQFIRCSEVLPKTVHHTLSLRMLAPSFGCPRASSAAWLRLLLGSVRASRRMCASAHRPTAAALTHKNPMQSESRPGMRFPFYCCGDTLEIQSCIGRIAAPVYRIK